MRVSKRLDGNQLMNWVRWKLNLRSDRMLSEALGVCQTEISRIRHKKRSVGAPLLVRILEATDTNLNDLSEVIYDIPDHPPGYPEARKAKQSQNLSRRAKLSG